MNISEIAKLAGVSRATVSRYLNNGYISEEKKEKIRVVIEQTGYIPSSQAQMLRTKKTKLIGVILPKISSESISKVVDGISEKLAEAGYQIILGNTDNSVEREIEYLNIFKNNQVDGIIFLATIISNKHKQVMKELPMPIVIVGQKVEGYCCVFHDDYEATKKITHLLIKSGCRSLGYIGVTTEDKAAGFERKRGFLDAVEEACNTDKCVETACLREGLFSMESGYELMKGILEDGYDVDGVYCATDSIAIGAMEAIKEKNKRIPEDISLVGMGDTRISRVVTPGLTTVSYCYTESGREAAAMLITLIEEKHEYTKKIKLGYKIVERSSIKQ